MYALIRYRQTAHVTITVTRKAVGWSAIIWYVISPSSWGNTKYSNAAAPPVAAHASALATAFIRLFSHQHTALPTAIMLQQAVRHTLNTYNRNVPISQSSF